MHWKTVTNLCNPIAIKCWLQEWKCLKMLPRSVRKKSFILDNFLFRPNPRMIASCYVLSQLIAPNTIEELYTTVNRSPARRYFMIVGCTMVGIIFIIGMSCGRVTRRTMIMKNKWRRRRPSTRKMTFVRLAEGQQI